MNSGLTVMKRTVPRVCERWHRFERLGFPLLPSRMQRDIKSQLHWTRETKRVSSPLW